MTESNAASLANQFMAKLMENQQSFWPTGTLANPANAKQAATNLATFRQQLIEELKKHSD